MISDTELADLIATNYDGVHYANPDELIGALLWRLRELEADTLTMLAALEPFARMHRYGCDPRELACERGTASDKTILTGGDFQLAYNLMPKDRQREHREKLSAEPRDYEVTLDDTYRPIAPSVNMADGDYDKVASDVSRLATHKYLATLGKHDERGGMGSLSESQGASSEQNLVSKGDVANPKPSCSICGPGWECHGHDEDEECER